MPFSTLRCLCLPLVATSAVFAATPSLKTGEDWKAELVAEAPRILFPTAIVSAPDGAIYLGQDPMDMPGPPTSPIDSIVRIKDGKIDVFAEKLWSVMGLEWIDGTLYVVHAPFLSALTDTDGDGKADRREDLMTGLGPKQPGFNGINDHVPSGMKLGMDGFLYIAVGDKGIPKGVGKDGKTISLKGGGVIRIRPDGSDLEIVSTGERNPLSTALTTTDEVFTYGNDDDSKKWPNSLTHHIVGAHYGYPFEFLAAPSRVLPVTAGQIGGSGAQSVFYNEDGLPAEYRGNLFVCDWGLQTVFRYVLARSGGTYKVVKKEPFVTKGDVPDFRPFSVGVSHDGASLLLVDWAYLGWLADGPQTGRLYRLTYVGPGVVSPTPKPTGTDLESRIKALDHPAHSTRLETQRALARMGASATPRLIERLRRTDPRVGRLHSIWALDALGGNDARSAIREALTDADAEVRKQAARSVGIRRDRSAISVLSSTLRDSDPAVRRETAIALEKIGDPAAAPALFGAIGDSDPFASWSIRHALRTIDAWDAAGLAEAFRDPRRRDDAIKLTDEAWSLPVVQALSLAIAIVEDAPTRRRIAANLAGLYRKYPGWNGNWFGTNPLAGRFPEKTEAWDVAGMNAVAAALQTALRDENALVRREAMSGLAQIGRQASPIFLDRLDREGDVENHILVCRILGALGDREAVPLLLKVANDAKRTPENRSAATDSLASIPGPEALRARFMLLFDEKAPAELRARILPALGRAGTIPGNDLAGFLEHKDARIRAASLRAFPDKKSPAPEIARAISDRLADDDATVKRVAMETVARLAIREAAPRLLELAKSEPYRLDASKALAAIPDPRATSVYLQALNERGSDARAAAEFALLKIRDAAASELRAAAESGRYSGAAAQALERVLTRFQPIVGWRVIGPFPRTTAQVFIGEPSIDFAKPHVGALGRTIGWQLRKADALTGRIVIDDFKQGQGDRGGFGYDTNGSPDLAAFGYAEIDSDREREALLLFGSSGTVNVTLNEKSIHNYVNFAGRPYEPDSDRVRVKLLKGRNRLLIRSRQGIGAWSFSAQVSEPSDLKLAASGASDPAEKLRAYAMAREGDVARGEKVFLDPKGVGCVKCHSAGGKGDSNIGPDLTGLAAKYDKAEIIRSVLEPSNRIATGYQPILIAKTDGSVVTGVSRGETGGAIEIADADAKITRIPKSEIEETRVGAVSIMPAGLIDTLAPSDFADLVAYLSSLKTPPPAANASNKP